MGSVVAKQDRYSADDVDRGLKALVLAGGNSRHASKALAEQGLAIPAASLRDWKTRSYRERHLEISAQLQPEIEKELVASTLDYLRGSEEAKAKALALLVEQIEAKDVKDPAKTLQNLAVSQGIGIDTVLKVQGRPTHLVQHSSVDESLATLKRLGIVVDSTAEEIGDAEVVTEPKPEGRVVAGTPVRSSGMEDPPEAAVRPATERETHAETPAHPLQAALDRPSS